MSMDTEIWTALMDKIVEQANYSPGTNLAPGSGPDGDGTGPGTEGDSPLGIDYIDRGPLALVLNESIDATVTRGADRNLLLQAIADGADGFDLDDVNAVLSGKNRAPDVTLLQAFSTACAVDEEVIIDAAIRGGAKNLGVGLPPGY
jgi:hypothetical protein